MMRWSEHAARTGEFRDAMNFQPEHRETGHHLSFNVSDSILLEESYWSGLGLFVKSTIKCRDEVKVVRNIHALYNRRRIL
jgi:hypothetical protein